MDQKCLHKNVRHCDVCVVDRYVLLHHVMGGLDGVQGEWAYVEGGMGKVSDAIANAALSYGCNIFTNKVSEILLAYSSSLDSSLCLLNA